MPEHNKQQSTALTIVNKIPENGIFSGSIVSGDRFILERPRLNILFEKALKNLIVFVSAGEGYGKTCAVHSFLQKKKAIWISMSERDNEPWHFWENVTKSVGFHNPGAGKLLEEIGFPETQGQIIRCFSALTGGGSAGEGLGRNKYVIVADDCHLVHAEPVLNCVNRLLAAPFPRETAILISRTELKLNAMSLLSKGFMSRISTDDLRFTGEEIAGYFRLRNISLSREQSQSILSDTEGWIPAISLIAQEMEGGNKKYERSLLDSGTFRCMEERIFASVPASIQRFLVILSIFEQWPLEALEKIAASLPEKLPAIEEFTENMNRLSSLVRYDAYLHGFRIHRIFLDYLREKQGELSAEETGTACSIMAQWCMKNHLWIDAAINYGAAGNYGGLLKAVYSFPMLLPRSAAASFLEIIDRIIRTKQNEEDNNFLFLRYVTKPGMLLNLGRYTESREALEKSIEKFKAMPPCDLSSRILSSCYNTLASLSILTYRETRDSNLTLEYFKRGNYYYERSPYPVSGSGTRVTIGSYANPIGHPPRTGEFEEFITTTAQCIPYASRSMAGFLSGMDSLCRAELAFFKGELDTAEKHAREAVFKARENGQYEIESKGLFYLLRIHLCNGNVSASRETREQMEALLDKPGYINRYVIHDIMTGWFSAHIGEAEQIAPWLRNNDEENSLNLLFHNYETMVKAKSLFAEEQYEEALKFLKQKEAGNGLGSFHLGILEITTLEAAVRSRLGDKTGATETLEAAYRMAISGCNGPSATGDYPEAFDMPFIELGEDMRTLAGTALSGSAIPRSWLETIRNKASVYAKKLATVAQQYRNGQGAEGLPFLTSQELSILAGISQGLTREKIAGSFSLSKNTVKGIIKTIYDKLGAFNRADAIRIATKAGFLKH